jgi:hypothetical protein
MRSQETTIEGLEPASRPVRFLNSGMAMDKSEPEQLPAGRQRPTCQSQAEPQLDCTGTSAPKCMSGVGACAYRRRPRPALAAPCPALRSFGHRTACKEGACKEAWRVRQSAGWLWQLLNKASRRAASSGQQGDVPVR